MSLPRGIPTVTYIRINKGIRSGRRDVESDGSNTVIVLESEKVNDNLK